MVPIVEPEVLMDGKHSIERCERVTAATLKTVYSELIDQDVFLEGTLLKPNMVLSGNQCPEQADVDEVADATIRTLQRGVPAAVPGRRSVSDRIRWLISAVDLATMISMFLQIICFNEVTVTVAG